MRVPTAAALQRATVAALAGAGIALVGLSVAGFGGLDANLKAAAEQSAPQPQRPLSFEGQPVRDCPRWDHRDRAPRPGLPPPHQPT